MEETTYKYSKYNIELESDTEGNEDEVTIFNTYTSKYVTLDKEVVEDLKCETDISEGDFPDYLIPLGIFVPSTLDETSLVLSKMHKCAHEQNQLNFVIQLSLRCNYRCFYCYQKDSLCNKDMSFETMNEVIAFIIQKCEEYTSLELLQIQWYGGEPLLAADNLFYINSKIKEYVLNRGIKYRTNITTNGSLLTKDVVDRLVTDANCYGAMISIDALAENYSKIKGCKEENFYNVIENIRYAQNKMEIVIRLNICNEIEITKEIIHYLANEHLNVKCAYYHIWDTSMTPQDYQASFGRFVELSKELERYIDDNNYRYLFSHSVKDTNFCLACDANATWTYAIDVDGNLYRCVEKITEHKYSIGNVKEGVTNHPMNDLFIENKLYSECESCEYMAICKGKCTMERLVEQKGVNCEAMKTLLYRRLKRYVEKSSKA